MKKIISLILITVLSLSMLVSCTIGHKAEDPEGTDTSGTSADTAGTADTDADTDVQMYLPPFAENAGEESIYSANYAFSNAHLSYIIQSSYQNILYNLQYYGADLADYGIDVTKSLKEQEYIIDDSIDTWFDYFLESAVGTAKEVLALCEAAKAAGYTLSEEANEEIAATIENYKGYAEEAGMTIDEYFAANLGENVTVEVFEETLRMSYLAQYYMADYIENLDLSDEKLEDAYNADPKIADTVDFLLVVLDPLTLLEDDSESSDDAETSDETGESYTDEELEDALNFCRTEASAIAKAQSKDAFITAATATLTNGFGMSAEEAEETLEAGEYTGQAYQSDVVTEKIFSVGEGETFVVEDETDGVVYVGILVKRNGRDESVSTRSVRHILFKHDTYKDDTVVKQVYDEWVQDGATVEDFIELAKEYSEDPGSANNGGLYEGVAPGEMVDEFNDWLFDSARVVGDHAIVETESYGWHIMYFDAEGEPGWKETVRSYIKNETGAKLLEDAEAAYEITVDEELLEDIPA